MSNLEFTKNSIQTNQLPPQNTQAEQAVLGMIMMHKEALDRVANIITPEDFYNKNNKLIYQAALDLYEKQEPVDHLSITSRLAEKRQLDEIGGADYLTSLASTVIAPSHLDGYARMIRRKKILRDMIQASYEISELGFQEEEDVEDLLDRAEQKIFKISQRSLQKNFTHINDEIESAFSRIEDLQRGGTIRGVSTGFTRLNNILSGLQKSDLIVLAARPSLGKTSLALDIARHVATKEKVPVGIFSLEMSKEQLVDRFISAEAFVDLWKLHTGQLKKDEGDFERINKALASLSGAPIYINDSSAINIMEMRAMARRLQAEHRDLGLIIVDYLQLMQARTKSDNMVQQITEISRSLKGLAKELNIPILALSQLSRAIEQRPGGKPKLSDLRESGSIEQDADVVIFIHREREDDNRLSDDSEILISKHRNGPIGSCRLIFREKYATFSDPDIEHDDLESAEQYSA
jgi:replicative DNA helicase